MRQRRTTRSGGARPTAGVTAFLVAIAAVVLLPAASANNPVTGAAFTTTNTNVDGTGHCKNGNEDVNCNIYDGKQYVWLNGGPSTAYVGDGDYFFAVLEPGGQPDPNDGGAKNLSDDFDAYGNRTFSVSGATVSYLGSHDLDSKKIRLADYADTSNPGGVYILAICSLRDGYPVNPSDCKYDAFKIKAGSEIENGLPLTVTKDANGSNQNTYTWQITKDVDKTVVQQVGGTVTFNYTINVTHDSGTISDVKVTGMISVFNPNEDGSSNTVPVDILGVTDELSDGTVCNVTGGAQTLTQFQTDFAYSCDLSALPQGKLDNTASVSWGSQFLDNGALLEAGSADFTFTDGISFTEDAIDECVAVTDSYASSLGTACVGEANPKSFNYSRTVNVPANGCQSYDNTATFTTNDTGATGEASKTVTVCGPADTGARTIGFWKTTNGQNLVKTYCNKNGANLGTYLAALGGGAGPFSDAPTGCTALKTYVYNILNGASATNMNRMLKAQMLGTALDVWFSGPGWTSNKMSGIKPPSNFLSHNNLGTFNMDTTAVCPMVDNLSTGSATCKNLTPSTNAVAAGAVPTSPMAMQAILDFAATIDPATPPWDLGAYHGANVWYYNTTTNSQDRTKQEILKNIFDQFNNEDAFGSF
jgi:hypothetical protein